MYFTSLEALDIFFRCAAVGQLILICGLCIRRPLGGQQLSFMGVAACTAAYLLLTAPIPNADYGLVRNLLLVLTDAWPFMVWLAALYYFNDNFAPENWSVLTKSSVVLYFLWHLYFFGFMEGRGIFHDISHMLAIAVLAHVIYVALQGLRDDLVDERRKARVPIVILISAYGILLATVELAPHPLWQHGLFNLFNSFFVFLAILLLARHILGQQLQRALPRQTGIKPGDNPPDNPSLPPSLSRLKPKLEQFMDDGGYRQSSLSITALAEQLECPEHHLRRLINRALGFRNFNAFLNNYRLRDARQQLADPDLIQTPILTIALNLGYGSIGPFNRAFKAQTGQTPSDYRTSSRIGAGIS